MDLKMSSAIISSPAEAPADGKEERAVERDAGFVSGGEDDDSSCGPAHSDDSGVRLEGAPRPPPKKRLRLDSRDPPASPDSDSPFRPWSFREAPQQEPLSLVKRGESTLRHRRRPARPAPPAPPPPPPAPSPPRVPPPHPAAAEPFAEPARPASLGSEGRPRDQRNYKNMTRERRIEANARERTRVHTISAAFDTLRKAVPSYSHNQKLSKLSVLRIACAYISALSAVMEPERDLAGAVENVTQTIHTEGKLRKKKDES